MIILILISQATAALGGYSEFGFSELCVDEVMR